MGQKELDGNPEIELILKMSHGMKGGGQVFKSHNLSD